ncbi:DUF2202 domain-containing protein [Psychroserpens sp.]|uniref:DUF2202 domain-containing protein n=1 Tax=Psychroserpens sp. TaxID=2020870 RepID=UPI002B277B67|nr:DUF2202 domain-containing protein [Psychroserpens sp.]
MKKPLVLRMIPVLIISILLAFLYTCSDDDNSNVDNTNFVMTESDRAALIFMLEEEKLARDTYIYLNDLWSINQFANIKNSEQAHMNLVENLLIQNAIEYTILPVGDFENQNLQDFYDQFVIDGTLSSANAFQIGATIEDLDIKDLQDFLDVSSHPNLIAVFEKLQCGSRNHLRSFVSGIENGGNTYTPQFLTQDEFDLIISGTQEQCN